MADKIQQMHRGGQRGNLLPIHRQRFRPRIRKKAVQIAIGLRIRREQALVQLNIQRTAWLPIGHLVGRVQVRLGIGHLHAIVQQSLMALGEFLRRDQ